MTDESPVRRQWTDATVARAFRAARFGRTARRVVMLLVGALVAVGLTGLFGPSDTTRGADAGDTHLEVTFPDVTRAGLPEQAQIELRRPRGFRGPVTLAVTTAWVHTFAPREIEPQPLRSAGDPESLHWTFAAPAGETLSITLALDVDPRAIGGVSGRVAALEDGRPVVEVPLDTTVMP